MHGCWLHHDLATLVATAATAAAAAAAVWRERRAGLAMAARHSYMWRRSQRMVRAREPRKRVRWLAEWLLGECGGGVKHSQPASKKTSQESERRRLGFALLLVKAYKKGHPAKTT